MRISEFILRNMEAILTEWEAFAGTLLPAAEAMTQLALRDHAREILEAVAEDLKSYQTRAKQSEKSKGWAPVDLEGTAAQTHAVLRAQSDFDINQLIAEYRALRASVLRMWVDASPSNETGVTDVIRFNEAIDQAIAESVRHFQIQVDRARNLLLGMLGHDLRSPLNSMVMTASYLTALNAGEEVSEAARRLTRGGASIEALLDDLVDFNRTRFGLGLGVEPADIDLAAEVADELTQLRELHPRRTIELTVTGDTHGRWNGTRLKQVVRNLVLNAIKYGSPDTPIHIALRADQQTVVLEVTNSGPAIEPATLSQMFEPLKRGAEYDRQDPTGSLGLGLFIVREIVNAHGGDVDAYCEDGKTTFVARLPRAGRDA